MLTGVASACVPGSSARQDLCCEVGDPLGPFGVSDPLGPRRCWALWAPRMHAGASIATLAAAQAPLVRL